MKKLHSILAACTIGLALAGCDDFLDYEPTAVIDQDKAYSNPEGMVTAAYAMLGDCWFSYPFNLFPYGDIASDDCLKGGGGSQDTGYEALELWSTLTPSTPGEMDELWYRLYCAISRCNRAIIALGQSGEEALGAETTRQRMAEVRFLRAHFYYKLVTVFRKVPWIDETVEREGTQEQVRNDALSYRQLFQKVIDDFKCAYDVLPDKGPGEDGRANKAAAAAYLAKCYLTLAWGNGYEDSTGVEFVNRDYMDSVAVYTDAVTKAGYGYLEDFGDIFLPEHKNSKESVFAVQCSDKADDHTNFGRANWSIMLNGCWGIWTDGWDFHKPSQDLVDAFKTRDGLPMFDDYADSMDYPVNGRPTAQKWDPRLFHTVGMPTFPYKYESAYTLTTDNSRTPTMYGYYTSMKEVPQRSKGETYDGEWQAFATNDYVLRYTDVMLMRAEALIELDRLSEARDIINDIRQRAKNSVAKHIGYAADQCDISLYPESYFADKESARRCLRWERRLEMAMENGRFFDLRRWGVASETLGRFFERAQHFSYDGKAYGQYYSDAHFTPGKNEFFPVPYNQMYYIPGLYTQNKNYN